MQISSVKTNNNTNFKGLRAPKEFKDPILKQVYECAINRYGLRSHAKHCDLSFQEEHFLIDEFRLGVNVSEQTKIKEPKKFEKYFYLDNFRSKRYNIDYYAEQFAKLAEDISKKYLAGKTIIKPIRGNKAGTKVKYVFDKDGNQISKEYIRKIKKNPLPISIDEKMLIKTKRYETNGPQYSPRPELEDHFIGF